MADVLNKLQLVPYSAVDDQQDLLFCVIILYKYMLYTSLDRTLAHLIRLCLAIGKRERK